MPQRKKATPIKYMLRRAFIAVTIVCMAIGAGWYIKIRLNKPEPANTVLPEPSSKQESVLEKKLEPQPEVYSEPTKDPEPEPEFLASPDDWNLIVINSTNYLPENYEIELETITENYRVDKRIADNVKLMFNKAKQDGINLYICSAYRSVEKQKELFEEKQKEFMKIGKTEQEAITVAATIVAKPGTSEHHTGLALDIVCSTYTSLDEGFADTPAFMWLDKNAHKYGFILRYPEDKQTITGISYEPWHYRYVGEENAARIKSGGYCLEEYVELLREEESRSVLKETQSESPEPQDEEPAD